MIQDSDLHIIINLVDLHSRTDDTELRDRLKTLVTKIFDKIDENTSDQEES